MKKSVALKSCLIALTFCFFMMVLIHQPMAQETKLKLKRADKDWLSFKVKEDSWKVKSPTSEIKFKKKGNDFTAWINSEKWKIKNKGDKYRIFTPQGKLRFIVVNRIEKIKIYQAEDDPQPWVIKVRSDKMGYKIKKGETKIGKAKFYPEKIKIKVKDSENKTLCSMKSEIPLPSPAVCLCQGLSEEEQMLLFGLLTILTR